MALTYFKRYRMEIILGEWSAPPVTAPPGYTVLPWSPTDVELHADAKFESFRDEIDSAVFPCLSTREGCLRLMQDISTRRRFIPQATWLAIQNGTNGQPVVACGTIQGVVDGTNGYGAVQNLGITPSHRGRGLGQTLLNASLHGFKKAGLKRVYLEVTAQNDAAVQLYYKSGFVRSRTAYKAVEVVRA